MLANFTPILKKRENARRVIIVLGNFWSTSLRGKVDTQLFGPKNYLGDLYNASPKLHPAAACP